MRRAARHRGRRLRTLRHRDRRRDRRRLLDDSVRRLRGRSRIILIGDPPPVFRHYVPVGAPAFGCRADGGGRCPLCELEAAAGT